MHVSRPLRFSLVMALLLAGCVANPNAPTFRKNTVKKPVAVTSTAPASPEATVETASRTPAPAPTNFGIVLPRRTPAPSPSPRLERAYEDRPDDVEGYQVHFVYVLPSDASDEGLDLDGTIDQAANAMNAWFASQADGHTLRVDTYNGKTDVTFLRLAESAADVLASPDRATADVLRKAVVAAGLRSNKKTFAMFYAGKGKVKEVLGEGGSGYAACYMSQFEVFDFRGEVTGNAFEAILLHEIIHAIGFVDSRAPHHGTGHAMDDPNDLMSPSLNGRMRTIHLDAGHDDYYSHGRYGPAGSREERLPGAASGWSRSAARLARRGRLPRSRRRPYVEALPAVLSRFASASTHWASTQA